MRIPLLFVMSLAALGGCATARPPQAEPVAPPSHSVAEADARLVQAARERAQAEAEFSASEQACYTKFLVNDCLDKAREKRRATLAKLRVVEIEANHFKRKSAADERDRELAKAEKEFQAEQARLAAEPPPAPREVPPAAQPKPVTGDRVAEHAARLNRMDAQEKAGAAKRAASVAAFEKRKRESEQRKREVEEKKKKAALDAH